MDRNNSWKNLLIFMKQMAWRILLNFTGYSCVLHGSQMRMIENGNIVVHVNYITVMRHY